MTTIFNDGVLEATLYENKWVFCRWIQSKHGRLQKALIRDLNLIEKWILKFQLLGWYTRSEIGHSKFHQLLIKFGCLPKEKDGGFQWFVKPISKECDLHVRI